MTYDDIYSAAIATLRIRAANGLRYEPMVILNIGGSFTMISETALRLSAIPASQISEFVDLPKGGN